MILAVGTRLSTPEQLKEGQKVVQIDIDEAELGRNFKDTIGVHGDAKNSLEELLQVISTMVPARESRQEELEAVKAERFGVEQELQPLESFSKAIRNAMPDDGILVPDMTQVGYYSRVHFQVYEPRTYLTSSYFGNLGFAYPVALGAKVANPDKAVVSVSGDGGFMFNVQELATSAMHGINVVAVVFNDSAYGNVMRDQKTSFDGRAYGSSLQPESHHAV